MKEIRTSQTCRNLVIKSAGKNLLGKPRRKCEDSVNADLTEIDRQ
jgi:hypothetical protein